MYIPTANATTPAFLLAFPSTFIPRSREIRIEKRRVSAYTPPTQCATIPASATSSDDFIERIRSINSTSTASPEDTRHLLNLITKDTNPQVRYAALSRLSNLPPPSSPDQCTEILEAARWTLTNDTEPSCQAAAADLIAGLKLNEGFVDLVKAYDGTSDWVLKFSIVAGVGEMRHPEAFDFLQRVLLKEKEEEVLVVAACVGALGDLGDKRGVDVVKPYLEHEDSSVNERAKIAFELLGSLP